MPDTTIKKVEAASSPRGEIGQKYLVAHKIILFMVCLRRLVRCGQTLRCFYYFFMIVVVISYKTKATARRALTFIVRTFVNDTIAIAVWTSFRFHVCV